jgi:chromosome segregation ATPase
MSNPHDDIPSVAEAKAKAAAEEQRARHLEATDFITGAKKFAAQFGGLLKAAEALEGIESMKRAEQEARAALDATKEELAVLSGQRDDKLQKLREDIEGGLRVKYNEAESLLARQHTLANEAMTLTADIAEKRKVLTDLERRADIAESRHHDVLGKLTALRGSIPSAA